ncbi:hypothetical protein D9757_014151 [Collybiopsis confluens]|uniref:Uncharacterized protein n=1 Tax=Collybiopsis confluens TaxID=2823264 RepID=A0A8H5FPM9_9AGAR|nr:hypothetical protein D9757_014151 [Collybiopsis confluens]
MKQERHNETHPGCAGSAFRQKAIEIYNALRKSFGMPLSSSRSPVFILMVLITTAITRTKTYYPELMLTLICEDEEHRKLRPVRVHHHHHPEEFLEDSNEWYPPIPPHHRDGHRLSNKMLMTEDDEEPHFPLPLVIVTVMANIFSHCINFAFQKLGPWKSRAVVLPPLGLNGRSSFSLHIERSRSTTAPTGHESEEFIEGYLLSFFDDKTVPFKDSFPESYERQVVSRKSSSSPSSSSPQPVRQMLTTTFRTFAHLSSNTFLRDAFFSSFESDTVHEPVL